jgi:general secretion pathway protein I
MSGAHSPARRSPAQRTSGFTLVEVLVALAIVAMGMAALFAALSSSADSASYLRDKTFAEWVAMNRIEEVRLAAKRPSKGKSNGEVEMAGQKWRWAEEVQETEVKGILRIDVSVRPASIPGDSDQGWYTTVSGIVGDALALPRGDMDQYATANPPGSQGGEGNPRNDNTQGNNTGNNTGNNSGENSGSNSGNNNPPRQPPTPPPTITN